MTDIARQMAGKQFHIFFFAIGLVLLSTLTAIAQSVSQDFPTSVTTNEIAGVIPARDVGDSRLTTFYYTFEGGVGDLFLNVVTKNFNGDLDIFAVNGLRPLTKIVVYADLSENETGRVLYFRKPEKLLLRVQGRTPSDDSASFRIKFAGSFVAARERENPAEPEQPKVTVMAETGVRVNSVGTIIEVIPKAVPLSDARRESVAEMRGRPTEVTREKIKPANESDAAEAIAAPKSLSGIPDNTEVDPTKSAELAKPNSAREKTSRRVAAKRPLRSPVRKIAKSSVIPRPEQPPTADPLANIRLVIQFKDGKLIERPINEVFKFSVDKGILTVISKDGSVGRFSILDVEKVTIQ